jgi:hypothetical protein
MTDDANYRTSFLEYRVTIKRSFSYVNDKPNSLIIAMKIVQLYLRLCIFMVSQQQQPFRKLLFCGTQTEENTERIS